MNGDSVLTIDEVKAVCDDVLIDGFGDLNSSTFLSVGDSMIYVHYLLID